MVSSLAPKPRARFKLPELGYVATRSLEVYLSRPMIGFASHNFGRYRVQIGAEFK